MFQTFKAVFALVNEVNRKIPPPVNIGVEKVGEGEEQGLVLWSLLEKLVIKTSLVAMGFFV